jgi:hypothetical protein
LKQARSKFLLAGKYFFTISLSSPLKENITTIALVSIVLSLPLAQ